MKIDEGQIAERLFRGFQETFRLSCYADAEIVSGFCESPIEALLLGAFFSYQRLDRSHTTEKQFFGIFPNESPINYDATVVAIVPQYKWGAYRIDFCFQSPGLTTPVFVECDGHDFHEKTKEQAKRDKARDRAIQEAGIPIIRFTGSEIFNDPCDCVHQIIKFLSSRFRGKN